MEPQSMTETTDLRSKIGLLTPSDVAEMLDVTTHTLAMWRYEKKGPGFVKLGRNIFYRLEDVKSWIEANVVPTERSTEKPTE